MEYDPDQDGYEIRVTPKQPEVVELEESQLIKKQVMRLQTRIDQGGS